MMKHSAFYTKHQAVLLKGIGKKKDPVARWLAHWEIVSGEEHQGKIDPCKFPDSYKSQNVPSSPKPF
jgi:hypothetical protein